MRISGVLCGVILTCACQIVIAGTDPLIWTQPAESPQFRDLLSDDAFQQRSRAVLDGLKGLAELEASAVPDHGIRYITHVQGSQVESWNLHSGDLITKAGQIDLWGGPIANRESRPITIFDMQAGRSRVMTSRPERLQILFGTHWRPELAYLRSKDLRNPRWDELLVVGIVCRESDPDLAESAWSRAITAGYLRNCLAEICGAMIALHQGRCDVAADFAYLARSAEPRAAKFVSPVALLRVMLANYKFDDAFELCRRFPNQLTGDPRMFQALADLHRMQPDAVRLMDAPSRQAEGRYHDDLLDRLQPLTTFARKHLPKLQERNGVTISLDNGIQYPMAFLPPDGVRDMEARIRFSVTEIVPGFAEGRMEVGLFPPTSDNLDEALRNLESSVVQIHALSESRIILKHGDPSFGTPFEAFNYPLTLKRTQEIRVVRIGPQVEIWVNGHRVLYQPLPPLQAPQLALMIRPFSVSVKIEDFQVHELLERR